MIRNISDYKDTSFLSIDKALSNKMKFSLLKNGVFCILIGISMSFGVVEAFQRIITLFVVWLPTATGYHGASLALRSG